MSLIEIVFSIAPVVFVWYAELLRRAQKRMNSDRDRLEHERHIVLTQALAAIGERLKASELRQEQRNIERLTVTLRDVVGDINQRIVGQLELHLESLASILRSTAQMAEKQRNEQMEAMHHARRLADRMDAATREFGKLVANNVDLLALAGQVRDALSLLGTRQDVLDRDILRQADSLNAMCTAVAELRTGSGQAADELLQQIRRALDAAAQRQAQANLALHKELGDSLGKAIVSMNKQLSSMGPLSQQAKLQTFR
jgi:hypothetical protein